MRSGIGGLLAVAGPELEAELRAVRRCDDDYATAGKPACDWADPEAQVALIDALVALEGRRLSP